MDFRLRVHLDKLGRLYVYNKKMKIVHLAEYGFRLMVNDIYLESFTATMEDNTNKLKNIFTDQIYEISCNIKGNIKGNICYCWLLKNLSHSQKIIFSPTMLAASFNLHQSVDKNYFC